MHRKMSLFCSSVNLVFSDCSLIYKFFCYCLMSKTCWIWSGTSFMKYTSASFSIASAFVDSSLSFRSWNVVFLFSFSSSVRRAQSSGFVCSSAEVALLGTMSRIAMNLRTSSTMPYSWSKFKLSALSKLIKSTTPSSSKFSMSVSSRAKISSNLSVSTIVQASMILVSLCSTASR